MNSLPDRKVWAGRLTVLAFAAVTVISLILMLVPASNRKADNEASADTQPPYATASGITLQPVGKSQGYSLDKQSAASLPRDQFVYADARGMTLYTFDGDPPDQSSCQGVCTEEFTPLEAPPGAQPEGDFTLIKRPNGVLQWALKGKALYTYHKDVDPGSIAGNSPALAGAPRLDGAGNPVGGGFRGSYQGERPEPNVLPEGWRTADFFPVSGIDMPPGLAIREQPDAAAFSLVDRRGHTIYVFPEGNPEGPSCFQALAAPLMAGPIGDFGIVDQANGIRQWTWRGQGMFTCDEDLAPGYANGLAVDGARVAAAYRLFQPPGVTIEQTIKKGAVLAADGGMTLYRRDGHILQSGGGHNLRRGAPARPAVGRDIGTDPRCGEGCENQWRPFLAPADVQADALARGFWSVARRSDGTHQWVYQGYALWLFAGDQAAGDMMGHDIYDITLSHDPETLVDVGTPMDGAAALWWSVAVP